MKRMIAHGTVVFIGFLLLGTAAAYALFGGVPSPSGSAAVNPVAPLDQAEAVSRAIVEAQALGLQGSPDKVLAKRMTLRQYDALTGFKAGPDATEHGLDPGQTVWVVGIKGLVEWAGPGRVSEMCPECNENDTFDNITIVLNEATGEKLASYAAGPGQPMPVSDEEPSLEDGAPLPTAQPTATKMP